MGLTEEEWAARGAIEGVEFRRDSEIEVLMSASTFLPVHKYMEGAEKHPDEVGSICRSVYDNKGLSRTEWVRVARRG